VVDSPSTIEFEPAAPAPPVAGTRGVSLPRWFAMSQAFLICGIPTQLIVAAVLMIGLGMPPFQGNFVSLEFFATLSLIDTALVALLILLFLTLSGETSRDVFIGPRSVKREMLRGLLLVPIIFIGVTAVVLGLRAVAPWMHNVETNPLEGFMQTPLEAVIFLFVVVLAGGVREELQRAFILHRFEQCLGGVKLGLAIFSVTFALLHIDQGYDVAAAVGLLGLFWGVMYVRRRSAVLGMTNHAGFNAVQVVQVFLARSLSL
jgi:membrane protease YdiL (CAAX protease family)